jgi:hypothetical protein
MGLVSNGAVLVNKSLKVVFNKLTVAELEVISWNFLEGLWKGTKYET